MKDIDTRVQEAINAYNKPVDGNEVRRTLDRMTRAEFTAEMNRQANIADWRVGVIAVILLAGLVVYQLWEIMQ
jgi:hypothetical protein